jgi:hypothetical protein
MSNQYARIKGWHELLFASSPQGTHDQLYKAFPTSRGYSSRQRDEAMFEAVLALALHQATATATDKNLHKVYCFVPTTTRAWFVEHLRGSTKTIFSHLHDLKKVSIVELMGKLFYQLLLGEQPRLVPNEPDQWVSFGFLKSDPIPEWMSKGLFDKASGTGS